MHVSLPKKNYYKIGEVANAFQVNTSLIRFWEKEFEIIKPKKNNKGNRMFTPNDIENFKLIYTLVKERGYTLEGAKQKLRKNPYDLVDKLAIINRLEKVKAELLQIKSQLD